VNLLNYIVGNSPRTKVSDKVYTSTEYPPSETIPLHNELSYLHQWPSKLFFFCLVPPGSRGETPIADSRRILAALDPETRRKFEKKGLQYIQNLHGGNQRLGKSWQAAFESEDKSVVEQVCSEKRIDFEWKADGGLRLVHNRQAVAVHPVTKEAVWFSQADLWHPSRFPPATRRVLMSMFQPKDMPNYVRFGDGSEISDEDFARVSEAYEAETVVFPWQVCDVLMLDNMLVAHGRSPFSGPRKILVAMS
jgi:alpha-ketoglutarate-dependent taurine dioxygenase